MLMYLTGIADDLIGVRYRGKFIFQIIAGALIAMSGLYIRNLFGFFGIGAVNAWLGVAATIFLAIFVINAINLIDGIDGLASGLSAIALTYYSYIFYQAGEYIYAMLAGATLGTLVPFFYYNVFGNAVYNNLKPGARVIVLEEGQRHFNTYIREWDGNICNVSTYPDSYKSSDWRKRPLKNYKR